MRKKRIVAKPFLFQMERFISDEERNISFPLWFNDSLIRHYRIETLVRKSMGKNSDGELELKAEKKYFFNQHGNLIAVHSKKYYENEIVENVTFRYLDIIDDVGFAHVEIIDSLHLEDGLYGYVRYEKETYNDQILVYVNSTTGDYLFHVIDESAWGTVSVDSLLAPTPEDVIVYGTPKRPEKKFQVYNIVTEKNVVTYTYLRRQDAIGTVTKENYPFYYKRDLNYSAKGNCIGFVDSTFSGNKYLNRSVSRFTFSNQGLPLSLTHKGTRETDFEQFEYIFYAD